MITFGMIKDLYGKGLNALPGLLKDDSVENTMAEVKGLVDKTIRFVEKIPPKYRARLADVADELKRVGVAIAAVEWRPADDPSWGDEPPADSKKKKRKKGNSAAESASAPSVG